MAEEERNEVEGQEAEGAADESAAGSPQPAEDEAAVEEEPAAEEPVAEDVHAEPVEELTPKQRRKREGVVTSAKPDKTITVRIEITRRHPAYEKVVRRTSTVHAHDERNQAQEGDIVRVIESPPRSRTKRWRLVEVLERTR